MLRWLTAGESHGPELIAVLEGLPAGVPVSHAAIQVDLERRKLGYGRGARQKFEQDELSLSSGVIHGSSIGSPIAVRIGKPRFNGREAELVEPIKLITRRGVRRAVELKVGKCPQSLGHRHVSELATVPPPG